MDARFPFGLPTVNNANYLWISLFYAALNPTGRAGFVMANSASDAGGSERELRRQPDRDRRGGLHRRGRSEHVLHGDPAGNLWFLDREGERSARRQSVISRCETSISAGDAGKPDVRPDHIEFLGNIVRLWRGEPVETEADSGPRMKELFLDQGYRDVPGLCRVATREEIAAQGWSLNPGTIRRCRSRGAAG